jgi:hypothetical protein
VVGRDHDRKTIITCVYVEKQIFSRTSRSISIKHGTNHLSVKGFQNCTIYKGPAPLQRGGNHKNLVRSLKNVLLENYSARICHIDFT